MVQRRTCFIVVLFSLFSAGVNGQQGCYIFNKINLLKPITCNYNLPSLPKRPNENITRANGCTAVRQIISINPVPASYSSSCLGFFCQKEWQLEKVIHVPVRLRLGSLEYVDKLEGK